MPIQENFSQILDSSELEVTEKNIYYSRPTTVFAAVAASIFTIIGVLGRLIFDSRDKYLPIMGHMTKIDSTQHWGKIQIL